jgi:tetratricopeptide (TPR) repeat protein
VLSIEIDTQGNVLKGDLISGPAMLAQSAIDAVRQWKFQPMEVNGKPAYILSEVRVVFDLGKDTPTKNEEEIAQRYFAIDDDCIHLTNTTGSDKAKAADTCKKLAEIAEEFPADQRFIEKRSAFVYAATSLMYENRLKEALHYANRAVEIVELGHDDNSGSGAAYYIRGFVEARLSDYTDADKDLTHAEEFNQKAIAWAEKEKFEHLNSYYSGYAWTLRIHGKVFEVTGRSEESQEKYAEADKYETLSQQ